MAVTVSDTFIPAHDRDVALGSHRDVLDVEVHSSGGARDCAFRDPSGDLVRIAQA